MVFSRISVCIVIPSMICRLDAESKSKLNAGRRFSYLLPYQAAGVTIRGWREKAPQHTSLAPRRAAPGEAFDIVDYSFALTLLRSTRRRIQQADRCHKRSQPCR